MRRALALHGLLLATTFVSTTIAGALWAGHPPGLDRETFVRGLPFSLTLLTFLLCHESGHFVMCRRYGLSASLPYFIPAPPWVFPLGTLGAFIRIRSRFPDRRALFDVGAAGPWAGFVVAIIALAVGLARSTVLPTRPEGAVLELGDSLLTAYLTTAVLKADPALVILHPVAFAGWFGLLATSINLLPAGQLDGGHVLYAALGRHGRLLVVPVLLVLGWLAVTRWPGWGFWGLIVVLVTGLGHPPTAGDAVPLGRSRLFGAAASMVLFVLTFVPAPFRLLP